ncbi:MULTISPECIES: thylakoid membrane photosystem I accumulation factor [[Limnothrix rosea] IAM M-220]|uniref:thylakoid membrane photosystem I accumulation factor n=1 Tax=[Limnothrix rosea] IAM M-220 TaxID=454133 RepID=UPI0009614CE0|nr:thioredoxin family protein [[Limnothrix rosea] IAM M-220]
MSARRSIFMRLFLSFCIVLVTMLSTCISPAWAGLNDDRYDGNIFVLYAGNGSLVPPRLSLKETRDRQLPALIVFYVDDNSDSKRFAPIVSEIQSYYEKVISIIPVAVDSIPIKQSYSKDEVGYYYSGKIPQTVILDQNGKVLFDEVGQADFNDIDNTFRKLFDLPLREGKNLLKPSRAFNEYNSGYEPQ